MTVIAFVGSARLAPFSSGSSHQPSTGLARLMYTVLKVSSAHRSSPASRASPAHVIRQNIIDVALDMTFENKATIDSNQESDIERKLKRWFL